MHCRFKLKTSLTQNDTKEEGWCWNQTTSRQVENWVFLQWVERKALISDCQKMISVFKNGIWLGILSQIKWPILPVPAIFMLVKSLLCVTWSLYEDLQIPKCSTWDFFFLLYSEPVVFSLRKIWPDHCLDISITKPYCCNTSSMQFRTVLMKYPIWKRYI